MSDAVFAYGTLEIPAVMEAVTGRSFPQREAALEGFARFLIRGRFYPGIIEERGSVTDGVLYEGVDPESLTRLDAFEGPLYKRLRVLRQDGVAEAALTYVIPSRSTYASAPPTKRSIRARTVTRACAMSWMPSLAMAATLGVSITFGFTDI